jgi:diguanylate cyclase (GGDEF)-like protein
MEKNIFVKALSTRINDFLKILLSKNGSFTSRQLETFLLQDEEFMSLFKKEDSDLLVKETKKLLENHLESFSANIDKKIINGLRLKINNLKQKDNLIKVVDDVILSIADAYFECLETFEKFDSALIELMSNIEESGEKTFKMLDESHEYLKQDAQKDKFILENMQEMNVVIKTENKLEKIQHSILNRINVITNTLEDKIVHKEEYTDKVAEELEKVKKELKKYKKETEELKSQINQCQQEMITDKLTGLHRKDFFETAVRSLIGRFNRMKEPFSLIMFDIDDFKKVNDTYGHVTGDAVLKKCGEIVRKRIRATDFGIRFGGEEFLILLSNAKMNMASSVAYSILEMIRETHFKHNQIYFKVTASFGVTEYLEKENIKTTLERADNNLYKAKRNGKNCVFNDSGKFTGIDRTV